MLLSPYRFAVAAPPAPGPSDPYWASVSLLLTGLGANGGTAWTDLSPAPRTIAPVGNVQTSTAESVSGGSSTLHDASGDYLTVIPNISLVAGDFCFEYFIFYTTTLTQTPVLSRRNAGQGYWISSGYSAGQLRLVWQQWDGGGVYSALAPVVTHTLNTWVHVCFERVGNILSIYSDGVLRGSYNTGSARPADSGSGHIGQDTGAPGPTLNGYWSWMRLTQRTGARYNGAHAVPTLPYPIS